MCLYKHIKLRDETLLPVNGTKTLNHYTTLIYINPTTDMPLNRVTKTAACNVCHSDRVRKTVLCGLKY